MKTPLLALLVFLTAAVGVCAATGQPAKTKPVLDKGMDAATILQLAGTPDQINPIKSEETKAETWIYRRKLGQTVFQTANTQAYIPAMIFVTSGGPVIGQTVVPDYRLKYARSYQMTALLMVDGKLHLARQWVTQEEEFAD